MMNYSYKLAIVILIPTLEFINKLFQTHFKSYNLI